METVNILLGEGEYKGPSEFEQHLEALTPLLEDIRIEGIEHPTLVDKLADLREDEEYKEISFLASETGIQSQHIAYLVIAAQLEKKTKIPTEAHVQGV